MRLATAAAILLLLTITTLAWFERHGLVVLEAPPAKLAALPPVPVLIPALAPTGDPDPAATLAAVPPPAVAVVPPASTCPGNADPLGVSRTVEIDTTGEVKMISNDTIDIKAAEKVAVTGGKITLN